MHVPGGGVARWLWQWSWACEQLHQQALPRRRAAEHIAGPGSATPARPETEASSATNSGSMRISGSAAVASLIGSGASPLNTWPMTGKSLSSPTGGGVGVLTLPWGAPCVPAGGNGFGSGPVAAAGAAPGIPMSMTGSASGGCPAPGKAEGGKKSGRRSKPCGAQTRRCSCGQAERRE